MIVWRRLLSLSALAFTGCALIGPDYERPELPVASAWQDEQTAQFKRISTDQRDWWKSFHDPVLDRLINEALQENLTIRAAGIRILSARAQLGVAIGNLYPQEQKVDGLIWNIHLPKSGLSERLPGDNQEVSRLWLDRLGPSVNWELDLWGKFRRAVESADAQVLAQVANYDSLLVSVAADVADLYIGIRTLERRLDIARSNVEVQRGSLKIAESKFRGGSSSRRDVEQAKTVLGSTQASIPKLEALLRVAKNALSVYLGRPPQSLSNLLQAESFFGKIPTPPVQVAVGIPLDLLRRRPDIREAEYKAQAQSAQIGVTKANLYPALSISGSFSFVSSNASGHSLSDLFAWGNNFYRFGPAIQWNILNYGQLSNQVRYQDALLQAALVDYQNQVLKAQKEVEDGLIQFLKNQDSAQFLGESTQAAKRSLDLATLQYREGIADFTTVLTAEQSLLAQQDSFATTLGEVAVSLIHVYRGMGGGWQVREGRDFIPPEIREAMAKRTDWGDLLEHFTPSKGLAQGDYRAPEW